MALYNGKWASVLLRLLFLYCSPVETLTVECCKGFPATVCEKSPFPTCSDNSERLYNTASQAVGVYLDKGQRG